LLIDKGQQFDQIPARATTAPDLPHRPVVAAPKGQPVSLPRSAAVFIARLLALLFAVSAVAGPGSAAARAALAVPANTNYVSLGDSYAAGYGIGASTGRPVAGCAQSTRDYPHQVAATLGLNLTDVSCSGAVTANIDTTAQVTSSGAAPVQDTALSASTNLVTLTVGGNDFGFTAIAEACAALSPTGGVLGGDSGLVPFQAPNCKSAYAPAGGPDALSARITTTVAPAVSRVLAGIKAKAPNAKILVVDYPAISTDQGNPTTCFSSPLAPDSFPFTTVDTPYLAARQAELNNAIKIQARAHGAGFVETYPQSLAHSACHSAADPWMNGITLSGTEFAPGSLHPNLQGATQIASVLAPAIVAARTPAPTVPTVPTVPTATTTAGGSALRTLVLIALILVALSAAAFVFARRRKA
jgi:lysophospholipase L1-like esterase